MDGTQDTKNHRISVFPAAIALTAMAGCAATSTQESTEQYVDDSAIATKVKAAIFNDPGSLHACNPTQSES